MEHANAAAQWSAPVLTALDQDSTLIAIIEMSQTSWLVGAIVPGIERHPLKKLAPDTAPFDTESPIQVRGLKAHARRVPPSPP